MSYLAVAPGRVYEHLKSRQVTLAFSAHLWKIKGLCVYFLGITFIELVCVLLFLVLTTTILNCFSLLQIFLPWCIRTCRV